MFQGAVFTELYVGLQMTEADALIQDQSQYAVTYSRVIIHSKLLMCMFPLFIHCQVIP